MEVRREDQEKINRFSSLHQKETLLEDELRAKIVSTILFNRFLIRLSSLVPPADSKNAFPFQTAMEWRISKSGFRAIGVAILKSIRKRRKI